jgi:hypothetical protein
MTKKSVDEIVRGIPKRVRDAAPFKKGDGVEMTGSGKLGDVIESDEDMTLVEWRDGSESRVDTSKLNRFRSMREFKRDAAAVDRAVAKIPRRGYSLKSGLDATLGRSGKKALDAALAKIPDRRAMDSFNKADVVTLKGSGKVGNVVESDEDMTLVAWHDGSESRVNTRKLKHADLARGHYGMGGNYDRNRDKLSVALAKIPRKR